MEQPVGGVNKFSIPLLGFAAASGTGKTTLLEQLIPVLKQQNVRVGAIKHSHHDFEIDKTGKDSFRLRHAGATPVVITSKYRRAIIEEFSTQQEPELEQEIAFFEQKNVDLILVEGFRHVAFPKIELHRKEINKPLLCSNDSSIIAVATDDNALIIPANLARLDLNDIHQIADFVKQFIKNFYD